MALLAARELLLEDDVASSVSVADAADHARDAGGNTAEIVTHPRRKLPPVADYAKRCAALIRETFPAPSQHQTCLAAARMTGASPDTFDRILSGITKSPDARLMLVVMAIRAARDPRPFNLGNGFAVRVTMEASDV